MLVAAVSWLLWFGGNLAEEKRSQWSLSEFDGFYAMDTNCLLILFKEGLEFWSGFLSVILGTFGLTFSVKVASLLCCASRVSYRPLTAEPFFSSDFFIWTLFRAFKNFLSRLSARLPLHESCLAPESRNME